MQARSSDWTFYSEQMRGGRKKKKDEGILYKVDVKESKMCGNIWPLQAKLFRRNL